MYVFAWGLLLSEQLISMYLLFTHMQWGRKWNKYLQNKLIEFNKRVIWQGCHIVSSKVNVHDIIDIHTWLSFYSLILQDLEEITHSVNDHPIQIALLKMENENLGASYLHYICHHYSYKLQLHTSVQKLSPKEKLQLLNLKKEWTNYKTLIGYHHVSYQ